MPRLNSTRRDSRQTDSIAQDMPHGGQDSRVQPSGVEYLLFEQSSYDERAPMFLFSDEKQLFQSVTHCLDVIRVDDAFEHKVAIVIESLALAGTQKVHTGIPFLTNFRRGNDFLRPGHEVRQQVHVRAALIGLFQCRLKRNTV